MKRKVQVWIRSQGGDGKLRMLILRTNAARGEFWQPVTGSVEEGESLEAAARREVLEETGFNLAGKFAPVGDPFTFENNGTHFVETAFAAEANPGLPDVRIDPREHESYRWVAPVDAIKLLKHESNIRILNELIRKGI